MPIAFNDYRGRPTEHRIRAMLHDADGSCVAAWGHSLEWQGPRFNSVAAAEEALGRDVYTCQLCLRGQGHVLER